MFEVGANGAIKLTRGDTARMSVNIVNDVTGEEYSMQEGDVLTMTVKVNILDEVPVIQKTLEGTNVFHIKPEDTASLDFGSYKYDVQLTTSDGDVYTIIVPSVFKILEEVTY